MLPIPQPLLPMEAVSVPVIPAGPGWFYEPKWDGFRCLAYRDGKRVTLWSKSGQDLTRYFPEVSELFAQLRATHFVLDGELIVPYQDSSSFEHLLLRIHPAQSRVLRLAKDHPAMFVAFDLLAADREHDLTPLPFHDRRERLEDFARTALTNPRLPLSPGTTDIETASAWLAGATGIDGVVAKLLDAPYRSSERLMQKIKRLQTADCVVGGFRYSERSTPQRPEVGSLLLGLYNQAGRLDHVGFTSSFDAPERARLAPLLKDLVKPPGFDGDRVPGGPSRWSTKRSGEWQPLMPFLVCEVRYDHFSEGRFRHGTKFLRWRPDKEPRQCTYQQVTQPTASSLALLRTA